VVLMRFDWMLPLGVGTILGLVVEHYRLPLWRMLGRSPDLNAHVEDDLAVIYLGSPPWIGCRFLLPTGSTMTTPPERCVDWWKWAHSVGGIDGDVTHLRVTLTGVHEDLTIVVDGVQARVESERPIRSESWKHVVCPAGGADIVPRHLEIQFEPFDPPTSWWVDPFAETSRPAAFTLKRGEVERIDVIARSTAKDVSWTADLVLLVNGKRRLLPLSKKGEHWRTIGTQNIPVTQLGRG
jgi:hypothetical protein